MMRALVRHPALVGVGAASLVALLALNVSAFILGLQAPWLLGSVILADTFVIGVGVLVAAREVLSARRGAEVARSALEASETRLAAIVEGSDDAIVGMSLEGVIESWNRAAERMFGHTSAQAVGQPIALIVPEDRRAEADAVLAAIRRGEAVQHFETQRHTKDGRRLDIALTVSPIRDAAGGVIGASKIARDITLRKRYEDDLKRQQQELRELSARVLEAREEEKARIARELHDELGQLLTALKMDLAWVRARLPAGELAGKADEMAGLLDHTVTSIRRISADLRPLMLDDLGLAEAASWLVEDFARRSGIKVEARIAEDLPAAALSRSAATAAYRAVQESLTNIARHSGASRAWVQIEVKDGTLHVNVEDDGRGISSEDLAKARSLGLKGMRERFAYLGGAVEIGRTPRGGARLSLRLPLRGSQPDAGQASA